MDWLLFIPTFFFVSITPGLCMTLSMTMGMTIGIKKTYAMMFGELIGVGLVAVCAVMGVATLLLQHPLLFQIFKYAGGLYLGYLGYLLWSSKGKMAISEDMSSHKHSQMGFRQLAMQGFVTAVANPKGWAFFITLLPPFFNYDKPLGPQLLIIVSLILFIEWLCLNVYAVGGKALFVMLQKGGYLRWMNRIAGTLMVMVGVWLAFG